MKLLRSVAMAFSMFSRIPMPKVEWKGENMAYAIAALPLVGLAISAALWLWFSLCDLLHFGQALFAVGVALLPVAVTGGIHLDGFADTVDALASHGPPEKKRRILKDPNAGAFAVIGLGAYLLLYTALASELEPGAAALRMLCLAAVSSRVLGALSVLALPSSKGGGILDAFKDGAVRGGLIWLFALAALCGGGWLVLTGYCGAAVILVCAASFALVARTAKGQFGGMSGDLSGFLIQVSEIAMLAAYVLFQHIASIGPFGF